MHEPRTAADGVRITHNRDGKYGKVVSMYTLKRRIARLAALGLTGAEIGKELGISTELANRALKYTDVQARVKALQDDADSMIKEALQDGELVAAEVLYDLMKNASNEKVRLEAAVEFLDRMGIRGAPIERVHQQTVQLTGDAAQAALVNALRDPGVQKFLREDRPDLMQKLLGAPVEEKTP